MRPSYRLSALLGILAALSLGLTQQEIFNKVFSSANTALRVSIISGGTIGAPTGCDDTEVVQTIGTSLGCDAGLTFDDSTNALTVTGQILAADGSATAPGYGFSADPDTGMLRSASGIDFYIDSGFKFRVASGNIVTPGEIAIGATQDLRLFRDGAADTLAQRNGTAAQTSRVYNLFNSATDYQRLAITGNSIKTEAQTSGLQALEIGATGSTWTFNAAGLIANTDNTRDIGASGVNRPRTGYFGTSVVTPRLTASIGDVTVAGLGSNRVLLETNGTVRWGVQSDGHFIPINDDGLLDFGSTGRRVRTGYFGTSVESPVFKSGTGTGGLIQTAAAGVAANPGTNEIRLYVREDLDQGSGTATADCALVARLAAGTEVLVQVLVSDAGC